MINHTPKKTATDLEIAIAEFLATNHVYKLAQKGEERRRQQEAKREEARNAFLAKREREHMALVDSGR